LTEIPRPRFNLIGPGRLGQTLTRLWQDAGLVTVAGILGRTPARSVAAREFIGAGRLVDSWSALPAAQLTLLATPDDMLTAVAHALAESDAIRPGDVVFHCSGAVASDVLAPLRARGALLASIHPLKSFTVPARAIHDFGGTYCGCEGDAAALALLAPLFDAIGARRFLLDPAHKLLYHAGAVLACNHLVTLMEAALRCMEQAGVPRATAWPALRPLINGTLANLDCSGTEGALSGPVARGDVETVRQEIAATRQAGAEVSEAYRILSALAAELVQPGK
jgi:predicted short-subunit dehydrogenase-like oxidoreductase (DUF2520 family)